MENQKNYYRWSTINILFLLLWSGALLFGADDPILRDLRLRDEKSSLQVLSKEPVFQWNFTSPVTAYDAELKLFQITLDGDSLIWEKELIDYQQSFFQLPTPHLLKPGNRYTFQIFAELAKVEESRASLSFRMNTAPEPVIVENPAGQIFTSDSLYITFTGAQDNEIPTDSLRFRVEICDHAKSTEVFVDTLVTARENRLLIKGEKLPENRRFMLFIKSYDSAEFSDWSDPFTFFINRIEEPPEPFNLKNGKSENIFTKKPRLQWYPSADPEAEMGGKITGYTLLISTFEDFLVLHEKASIPAEQQYYLPKNYENHRKYYWQAVARDSDSLMTKSNDTGIFFVNHENNRPPKASIIKPKNKEILKPDSYIHWLQERDPDKWDRLSYKIYIYKGEEIISQFHLQESKLDSSYKGLINDIHINYDNSVRLKLKYLQHSKLNEGQTYSLALETFDNWGASNRVKPDNATFIYDDDKNFPPEAPKSGFSPDSLIITSANPLLSWNAALDTDISDRLKYEVYISTNPTFRTTRYIQEMSAYDENFIKIKKDLLENKQYFWKVRAIDLMEKKSQWSKLNTFWVNAINEPPQGPVKLLYPRNYTEFNSESSFWWIQTTDNDPGDRIRYLLEIATDRTFRDKIYSFLIPAPGQNARWPQENQPPSDALGIFINEHSEVYKLIDNRMYYWRITALDNENLSSPLQTNYPRIVYNVVNDPPDIPAGFSPGKGKIITTDKPVIRWQHSIDPDFADLSTTLSYQLALAENKDFPKDKSFIYSSKTGENHLQIPISLTENAKYYYKLNAFDSHGAESGWSIADSFFVNAKQESPKIVSEMFPRDSVQIKSDSPNLQWKSVSDPDPDYNPKEISYTVKYLPSRWIGHKKEKKHTHTIQVKNGETSLQLSELEENEGYTYWIQAIDKSGQKSGWSKAETFFINESNEAPGSFTLLYPSGGADSVKTKPEFLWQKSLDPDPDDNLTYKIFYSEDSTFKNNVKEAIIKPTGSDTISYIPYMELKEAAKYFWKVSTEDKSGKVTWGSNSNDYPMIFYTIGYRRQLTFGPEKFMLHDNSPNPFYSKTRIEYEVKDYGNVRIAVYNVLGEKVKTLVSGNHVAGFYSVEWDGTDESGSQVPGGMYLCRMTARGFVKNQKMLLLR